MSFCSCLVEEKTLTELSWFLKAVWMLTWVQYFDVFCIVGVLKVFFHNQEAFRAASN